MGGFPYFQKRKLVFTCIIKIQYNTYYKTLSNCIKFFDLQICKGFLLLVGYVASNVRVVMRGSAEKGSWRALAHQEHLLHSRTSSLGDVCAITRNNKLQQCSTDAKPCSCSRQKKHQSAQLTTQKRCPMHTGSGPMHFPAPWNPVDSETA